MALDGPHAFAATDREVLDEVGDLEDGPWPASSPSRRLRHATPPATQVVGPHAGRLAGRRPAAARAGRRRRRRSAYGQRGRKAQPDGGSQHVGRRAGDRGEALAARAPGGWPAARACTGGSEWSKRSSTSPRSTDAAGVHHLHPVGDAGDDAEVVGDEHDRRAAARAGSAGCTSRICACTVTSSAVVGSSAISTSGSLAIAMAIIARWRMPPENSCGYWRGPGRRLRDADEVEQLDGPVAAPPVVRHLWCGLDHLGDLVADRCTGFSADSGSWKIIAIRLPRTLRCDLLARRRPAPGPAPWPSPSILAVFGSRPMTARNVTDLPEPRLADDAEHLARARRRGRRRGPPAPCRLGGERDAEIAELEHRCLPSVTLVSCLLGIEGVAQAVADEVDRTAIVSSSSERTGRRTSHQLP